MNYLVVNYVIRKQRRIGIGLCLRYNDRLYTY